MASCRVSPKDDLDAEYEIAAEHGHWGVTYIGRLIPGGQEVFKREESLQHLPRIRVCRDQVLLVSASLSTHA